MEGKQKTVSVDSRCGSSLNRAVRLTLRTGLILSGCFLVVQSGFADTTNVPTEDAQSAQTMRDMAGSGWLSVSYSIPTSGAAVAATPVPSRLANDGADVRFTSAATSLGDLDGNEIGYAEVNYTRGLAAAPFDHAPALKAKSTHTVEWIWKGDS